MSQSIDQVFDANTEQFARLNAVKPQTVLKRYCHTGSYHGVVPKKLANRRLLWPSIQVESPK
jgi:hypothetical protein